MNPQNKPQIVDFNALLPTGYLPTAEQVNVSVDGVPMRVVRYSHCDVPFYFVHASLAENVEHGLALSVKRHHGDIWVYPSRLGLEVTPQQDKQPAAFRFSGAPYLVVECEGLGYLMLAFEPPASDPEGPGVLRAADLGVTPNNVHVQTPALQAAIDRVSADSDLHTLVLTPGLYRAGDLHLRSNCRLHLCGGAVLQASDNAADIGDPSVGGFGPKRAAFINALSVENLSITGPGHIDGNRPVLDLQRYFRDMVCIKGCRSLRIDGPVFSSSCNWNTHLRGCEDVEVTRLKILNNRPPVGFINTDGLNPDCCRRVAIRQCLMHTGDDAVAVKSCGEDDGLLGDVADIVVSDLLAINNSATAKIGTETCAARMERIRFERIDAVHTARLCVIDAFDLADIRDVVFEDIRLNRLDHSRPGSASDGRLIDLHASAPTWRKVRGRSRIKNVHIRNLISDEPGRCLITGLSEEYGVSRVRLKNVRVAGKALQMEDLEQSGSVRELTLDPPAEPNPAG